MVKGCRLARPTWLVVLALLCGLLASMVIPTRTAQAAPVVSRIGSAADNGPPADITITTTQAVAAGNSIVVNVNAIAPGVQGLFIR
jgi:hypothetical protein